MLGQVFTLERGEEGTGSRPERQSEVLKGGREAGEMAFSIVSDTGNIGEGERRYDYAVQYTPVSQSVS